MKETDTYTILILLGYAGSEAALTKIVLPASFGQANISLFCNSTNCSLTIGFVNFSYYNTILIKTQFNHRGYKYNRSFKESTHCHENTLLFRIGTNYYVSRL
jgi:long-subunit fatty acid transport protein